MTRFFPTFVLAALLASPAAADTWSDQFGLVTFSNEPTDGRINALALFNGDLVAAGSFTTIGGIAAAGIASWDGNTWSALGTFALDGPVYTITEYNGGLAITGSFTHINGQPAEIGLWDGVTWTAVDDAGLASGAWSTATDGPNLYLSHPNGVVRWDGSSASLLGTPEYFGNGGAWDLLWWNGTLYATGFFGELGGVTAQNVASWDGTQWHAMGSGLPSFGTNLFVDNGTLKVRVTDGGGGYALCSWSGTDWSVDIQQTAGCAIMGSRSVAMFGGKLIFSAVCGQPGGTLLPGVAAWTGSAWQGLGGGVYDPATVNTLTGPPAAGPLLEYQNRLVVGGDFGVAGAWNVSDNLAIWDGQHWLTRAPDERVRAVAVIGSDAYAGGDFTVAYETDATHVARWDGSGWQALGGGVNGTVDALLAVGTDLYVGGEFTDAGGSGASYLARWNGSAWSAVGPSLGGPVYALAWDGSNLYAGGSFVTLQSEVLQKIARWDGSTWHAIGGGFTGNGAVRTIATNGTDVYAAGDFQYANYQLVGNTARFDGTSWSSLGYGLEDGAVRALAFHGGALYAAGDFIHWSSQVVNHLARWDGTAWNAVGDPSSPGTNGPVRALLSSGNGLYAAGAFTTASVTTVNHLGVWDGGGWHAVGGGTDGGVDAVAIRTNNLYIGGQFANVIGDGNNPAWVGSNHFAHRQFTVTAVSATPAAPVSMLDPAVPNPFNPNTRIDYRVPRDARVRIDIYDAAGRRVRVLVDKFVTKAAGTRSAEWDGTTDAGTRVASGVFFVRMKAAGRTEVQKIVLLK